QEGGEKDRPTNHPEYLDYSWSVQCIRVGWPKLFVLLERRWGEGQTNRHS
ncbi:hypothetical protein GBAR_LOCUS12648, partial [Geodia barretti]